jgi:hypothetical protein
VKTLDLWNASSTLGDYVAALGSDSIVVTSKKKPLAALVPLKNVDRESLALSMDPAFLGIVRRARAEAKRGKVYSLDALKREAFGAIGRRPIKDRQKGAR